jgi:D-serine deaminase-like pyridoxal phosphate-dependent protein
MDISLQTHQSYIGKPVNALPTPALVLSKPVLEKNVKRLHDDVEALGIGFRPHVKTLKVQKGYQLSVERKNFKLISQRPSRRRG